MKYLVVVMAAITLAGQTAAEKDVQKDLTSKLAELQRSNHDNAKRADELTQTLLAVVPTDNGPTRATVGTLARRLAAVLSGRALPPPVVNDLASSLTGVLRSAGMGNAEYKALLGRFEKALSAGGVSADAAKILSSIVASVGNEVRGPQDMPVLPLR